jgi:molybdopterin-guanine dinucleotide biosynthesis protein A
VSIGPGAGNPAPSFPTVEDPRPGGRGPLAGIAAAYRETGRADLLVLACDYPEVDTDFLRAVCAAAESEDDLVFPVDPKGRDHPLVAVWKRTAEPVVREALDRGQHKVRAILPELVVKRLRARDLPGFDLGRVLLNLNRPEDLLAR